MFNHVVQLLFIQLCTVVLSVNSQRMDQARVTRVAEFCDAFDLSSWVSLEFIVVQKQQIRNVAIFPIGNDM